MTFPLNINLTLPQMNLGKPFGISINGPVTCFVGPNSCGKSLALRALKNELASRLQANAPRFLATGRLGQLEMHRADQYGHSNGPDFDNSVQGSQRDTQYRLRSESIVGDLHSLTARADLEIKVQERLSKLFDREIHLLWDSGNLKTQISRKNEQYTSTREGSGLLNLISILTALYNNENEILMIDEPELGLHPQLQSYVLNEIFTAAGKFKKAVVYTTHSPNLIKLACVDDLSNIVFFNDLDTEPKQVSRDAGELQNKAVQSLLFRIGVEHKAALFAAKPLIVEGISDQIIADSIANRLGIPLDAAGCQILPVIGKGQIAAVTKLFRLVGKKPAALMDLDALLEDGDAVSVFSNTDEARVAAEALGAKDANRLISDLKTDLFTFIDRSFSSIESYAKMHLYWIQKKPDDDLVKVKRRAAAAALMGLDAETLSALEDSDRWKGMKARITATLNILSRAGCFVLSKGTIESYYQSPSPTIAKPNAAIEEVSQWHDAETLQINYAEICKALNFCAQRPEINEFARIKRLALAIAGPAVDGLNHGDSETSIRNEMKNIVRERSTLFTLDVDDSLTMNFKSAVLDGGDRFPIIFEKGCNPSEEVERAFHRTNEAGKVSHDSEI